MVIQEGGTGFETSGHGGPIYLGKDVIGQVIERIEGHHPGHSIATEGSRQEPVERGARFLDRGLIGRVIPQGRWIVPFAHQ